MQKRTKKFERRFREVERIVAARGLEMTGVDLETMEEVWQQVNGRKLISKGNYAVKRHLCHFLNDKRLICVKTLPQRGYFLTPDFNSALAKRRDNESLWHRSCSGILLSRHGYSIVFST